MSQYISRPTFLIKLKLRMYNQILFDSAKIQNTSEFQFKPNYFILHYEHSVCNSLGLLNKVMEQNYLCFPSVRQRSYIKGPLYIYVRPSKSITIINILIFYLKNIFVFYTYQLYYHQIFSLATPLK